MSEIFRHQIKVLFQHCDPAGIVFYPRYFEMVNQTVEEWHDAGLGHSFAQMHMESGYGVPTVSIGAEFTAPSHMGDLLTWSLSVLRLGRTSAHLRITAKCGSELRMTATPVLVYVHMDSGRAVPWSDNLRAEMQRYLGDEAAPG
ncbi:thioesterase family protein [uncultured Roseobacter sp.]|uniref:acyl-CoA thioesterase n=1 Tax=uncultured Roseobacter sp. TaxID=114847 RepID=UPI00260CB403|nr:thioesterase family protein [uncultured Roseobacter sp.]